MPHPLQGVFATAITPRRSGDSALDLGAALDVLDYLNSARPGGIAVLDIAGEFIHFSIEERIRLAQFALKRARVPVLVNVSHSTLEGAVQLAESADEAGAAGLALLPPYFYRYSRADIQAFYAAFAREYDGSAPVLQYNAPAYSAPLEQAMAVAPFAGVIDSTGTLQAETLFTSNDRLLLRSLDSGAAGVVSDAAAAVPELVIALAGSPGAAVLRERFEGFLARTEGLPAPFVLREALALRGVQPGPRPCPIGSETARRLVEFGDWFPEWLSETKKVCAHVQA